MSTVRSVSFLPVGLGLVLVQDVLELVAFDALDDAAEHLDQAAIGILGKALVAGQLRRCLPASVGLRPTLSTVSIMPGMENLAPERTDTSSGLLGIAKLFAGLLLRPA